MYCCCCLVIPVVITEFSVYVTPPPAKIYLSRITHKGWCPSLGETSSSLLFDGDAEAGDQVLVFARVDLESALDQIQRHDHCVGQTTGQGASQAAQGVVLGGAEFA